MRIKVSRRLAKSALTKTGIPGFDYCLNPYTGCGHACRYCYVNLMKRFFGHAQDQWGTFIDVKTNVAEVLRRETRRKKRGEVFMSSVTDLYQPLEEKLGLTRKCLEILCEAGWPVTVQTKSSLILRDIDLLAGFEDIEVGITITTNREKTRKIFEPNASSIPARIRALEKLRGRGIPTYAFVGPILPMDPVALARRLEQAAEEILIDRMNYPRNIMQLLKKHGFEYILEDEFQQDVTRIFEDIFGKDRVSTCY